MSRALLDVNVLLALLDTDHVDHRRAHEWLDANLRGGWASCAITQNGFVRVISQPRYPNGLSPTRAVEVLRRSCESGDHEFWPCEISVLDPRVVDGSRLHGPRQVTDAYLLALAVTHNGRFATFDRGILPSWVPGATAEHVAVL